MTATDINVALKGRVGSRNLADGNEDTARWDQHGGIVNAMGGKLRSDQ